MERISILAISYVILLHDLDEHYLLQGSRPLCAVPRQATPPSATLSHLYQVRRRMKSVLYVNIFVIY